MGVVVFLEEERIAMGTEALIALIVAFGGWIFAALQAWLDFLDRKRARRDRHLLKHYVGLVVEHKTAILESQLWRGCGQRSHISEEF